MRTSVSRISPTPLSHSTILYRSSASVMSSSPLWRICMSSPCLPLPTSSSISPQLLRHRAPRNRPSQIAYFQTSREAVYPILSLPDPRNYSSSIHLLPISPPPIAWTEIRSLGWCRPPRPRQSLPYLSHPLACSHPPFRNRATSSSTRIATSRSRPSHLLSLPLISNRGSY